MCFWCQACWQDKIPTKSQKGTPGDALQPFVGSHEGCSGEGVLSTHVRQEWGSTSRGQIRRSFSSSVHREIKVINAWPPSSWFHSFISQSIRSFLQIPDLLKCLIVRYTEANKFKCSKIMPHNYLAHWHIIDLTCFPLLFINKKWTSPDLFAVTSRSCPVFPVSLCRALSDSECCLDGLQVVGVACDLCPKLIQSDSANILCKLLTILYRQTYFQINHSSGEVSFEDSL